MIKQPMLASAIDLTKVKYPVLVSPKLDGIRAIITKDGVLSRSLKMIPNKFIQETLMSLDAEGLDGELLIVNNGSENFGDQTSGIMSIDGTPDFVFLVFDCFTLQRPFHSRIQFVYERCAQIDSEYVQPVIHHQVDDEKRLLKMERTALKNGYEGLMVRSLHGPYKQGRSTANQGYLLKLKRFEDSEAEIIGFEEELENANAAYINEVGRTARSSHKANKKPKGRLGKLIVRDIKSGITFSVGSGLRDRDKTEIWENQTSWLGRIIKYKHLPYGKKDKPRFPVFLGERSKLDL